MDINITKLSDKEIAGICVKYNIIQPNELRNYTRDSVIQEIQKWCHYKKESYRKRSNSSPNIMMNQQNQQNQQKTIHQSTNSGGGLKRTNSAPLNIQKVHSVNSPPQSTAQYQRDRRMSEPFTAQEKVIAQADHQAKQVYNQGQAQVQQQLLAQQKAQQQQLLEQQQQQAQHQANMDQYDELGMYPAVRRLIAMGDLHGDLRVTLIALRFAKVIPQHIFP